MQSRRRGVTVADSIPGPATVAACYQAPPTSTAIKCGRAQLHSNFSRESNRKQGKTSKTSAQYIICEARKQSHIAAHINSMSRISGEKRALENVLKCHGAERNGVLRWKVLVNTLTQFKAEQTNCHTKAAVHTHKNARTKATQNSKKREQKQYSEQAKGLEPYTIICCDHR